MARLTRAESQAQTRARLIDAMTALVSERGFRGAPLDEICERAGYSRGAFYSQFKSRDELMLACLERHLDDEIVKIDGFLSAADSLAALPQQLSSYYASSDDRIQWCLLQIEFQLYAARDEELAQQFEHLLRRFRERIAGQIERTFQGPGKLPLPALEIAAVFLAISYGVALQRAGDRRITDQAARWGISALASAVIDRSPALAGEASRD